MITLEEISTPKRRYRVPIHGLDRSTLTKTQEEAHALGFFPLTVAFSLTEDGILRSCLNSLRAGGIAHCLVLTSHGHEVWRAGIGPNHIRGNANRRQP